MAWYDGAKRDLPWRRDITPYRVWLSEIMLQQTRVEAGREYFLRFTETLPDVETLANVPDELLMKLWEGLGYYNRARNLKKAAGVVMEQYGGQLPSTYEELLGLPGIGPYTAGAISSIAFGRQRPAVDGNVLRVVMRLLGRYDDIARDSVKKAVEDALLEVMKEGEAYRRPGDFNQSLMELGAIVCIPNGQPRCDDCPWAEVCAAKAQNIAMELPVKQTKKQRRIEEKTVLLLWDQEDRLLLHRRDGKGLLAGLWELPSLPGKLDLEEVNRILAEGEGQALVGDVSQTLAEEGASRMVTALRPAGEATHIFSHVEWHMTAFEGILQAKEDPTPGERSTVRKSSARGVAEEPRPYLRDVKEETPRWMRASRQQIRDEVALPSAFKGFRSRILGES
ncbi:MAG: A/G-specific adenine glycosylase [Firmicutes bacterium]|nr:A/G-specific adenine glycosylase [Bacillota bacterium]